MDVSIQKITSQSAYLNQVIELGDKNKGTLGFLPQNAFINQAKNGNIIIAVTENKCVGYLLYRKVKTKNRVSITHLCIDENYRKNGIARKLVTYIKDGSKEWDGIGLYCRRDYESNEFWAHMGFRYLSEKPGRGKDQKPLTFYWFDHGKPSLFKLANEMIIQSKPFQAVIDMNIFIALYENPDHPLYANWLLEDLVFCVTPELCNEINRDDDKCRRKGMLSHVSNFPELSVDRTKVDQIFDILSPCYPSPMSTQDHSDLIQLSYAISGEADFFVTKDKKMAVKLKDFVRPKFGLLIVSVDDLIVYFDKIINEAAYQTNRLAGSLINVSRVTSGQADFLANVFHRNNETKGCFREKLSTYLSDPQSYDTFVITTQDQNPIALIVQTGIDKGGILEVPLIMVIKSPLSPALESQLIFWSVSQAAGKGHCLIRITDQHLSKGIIEALKENSFVEFDGIWEKVNLIGLHPIEDIEDILRKHQENFLGQNKALDYILNDINKAIASQDINQLIGIEKLLWPLKISSSKIPTYLVPIQANWAIDLFDYKLGSQTLFGSNPSLVLRMENVYYRSSQTKLPQAPSRVLWYVSRGTSTHLQGVMSIRACSYVEDVVIGSPKILFNQFKKLGVYSWKNVFKAAGNNLQNEILSFRFSRTEMFDSPIKLSEFKLFSGSKSAPQAPQKIDNDLFFKIYQHGITKR